MMSPRLKWTLSRFLAVLLLACAARAADPLVYVGTYTGSGSKGIYAFRLQMKTGKLAPLGVAGDTSNPSFLVEHPNHGFLYAVNENGNASQMGSVSAFAIDAATGKLKLLNWVSSRGGAPCRLAFDRTGRWLAVANCAGGSVAVLPVAADGKLGDAVWYSKTGGRAQGVAFSPDNRFLLVADPTRDGIFIYQFDPANGALAPHGGGAVKPGSGVGQLAFHPSGKALYAVNENASTVTAFAYDAAAGKLAEIDTVTTLPGFSAGNKAAAIELNSAGNLVYVSNRGHDSIYTYAVDSDRFTLSPAGDYPTLGNNPRNFTIDPTGQYLLVPNEDTSDVAAFKIHARTGQLTPAGKLTKDVSKAACVMVVESVTVRDPKIGQ